MNAGAGAQGDHRRQPRDVDFAAIHRFEQTRVVLEIEGIGIFAGRFGERIGERAESRAQNRLGRFIGLNGSHARREHHADADRRFAFWLLASVRLAHR